MSTATVGRKRRRGGTLQWVGHLTAFLLVVAMIVCLPVVMIGILLPMIAFVVHLQTRWKWRTCLRAGLVVLALLFLLILAAVSITWLYPKLVGGSPFNNPLLNVPLYAAFLLGLVGLVWFAVSVTDRGWLSRRNVVRQALARELGFPEEGDIPPERRGEVLALVPCLGRRRRGALARLGGGRHLWLCFLPDRMLVISAGTGESVSVSREELGKLYLVENRTADDLGLVLEDRGGEESYLVMDRLDDLVRVVNVLMAQGIAVRFREAPRLIEWGRYRWLWGLVRTVGLYELAGMVFILGIVALTSMDPGKKKDDSTNGNSGKNGATGTTSEPAMLVRLLIREDGRLVSEGSPFGEGITAANVGEHIERWRSQAGRYSWSVTIVVPPDAAPALNPQRREEIRRWFEGVSLTFDERGGKEP